MATGENVLWIVDVGYPVRQYDWRYRTHVFRTRQAAKEFVKEIEARPRNRNNRYATVNGPYRATWGPNE